MLVCCSVAVNGRSFCLPLFKTNGLGPLVVVGGWGGGSKIKY